MQTINLGQTIYGGYLNVTTGLLTVTHRLYSLDTRTEYQTGGGHNYVSYYPTGISSVSLRTNDIISEVAKYNGDLGDYFTIYHQSTAVIIGVPDDYALTSFNSEIAGTDIVYPLATPQTYQLTPAQIEQLLGQNNVFCSSGDVAVKYWKID